LTLRRADLQRRVKCILAIRFEARELTSFGGLELIRRCFHAISLSERLRHHLGGTGLDGDYGLAGMMVVVPGQLI
jgi:hypothetical protein